MTARSTTAAGARAVPPAEEANPTPQVGSKPSEKAKPEKPADLPIEFEKPPAMRVSEPAPGTEMIKVKTTGKFIIVDPTNLYEVPHDKAATVPKTTFIETCIEDGRLEKA